MRAGQLRTLYLFLEETDQEPALVAQPRILAGGGYATLFWVSTHVGGASPVEFAAPTFAALSALYLDASNVWIYIAATVRLRVLHIVSENLKVGF